MSAFSEHFLRDGARSAGWLRRLVGRSGAREPRVFLGAFGKHPGWDDHLDDIGLQTESLALAKQLLYVEGIGGQLNAGAWDRLSEEERSPGFRHVFLWRRGGGTLLGRLWTSTDGKGRGRYPMVLCAEPEGLPLEWALAHVLPRLEAIESVCRATDAPEEVRAVLDGQRQELTREAADRREGADLKRGQIAFPWTMPAGPGVGEEWLRALYGVRRQLDDYQPGRRGAGRPRELRLSRPPDAPAAETLRTWAAAFGALLDPAAPMLLLLPLEGAWLDVIVGEPVSDSFFALRATPAALPPADQVPYTLDAAWRQQAAEFLAVRADGGKSTRRAVKKFWRASAG